MNKNEVVSIALKIEGDQAKNQLSILEKEARDLEKAIKEVPKGGKEWAELNKQLNANTESQKKLRTEIGITGLTYNQLSKEARSLERELKAMTENTTEYVEKSKRFQEVKARMTEISNSMKGLNNELDQPQKKGIWGKMADGFGFVRTAAMGFMALQIVQTVIGWGKAIFDITGKFEGYEAVLKNALGSQDEAKKAMEAIKKMAVETAFGVDELTDGYIKMVNRGLRPSRDEMMALGDLAASQGKSFDQLIEAVLDAQTGEMERLKEFGVRARKEGDSVALTFKGQTQVVKQNEEAIYGALIAMGQMTGVAGQNAAMMETMTGKVSNIEDAMDALMVSIGNRLVPVFKFFLDLVGDAIEWFGEVVNATDPIIKVFEDVFGAVGDLISTFTDLIVSVFPAFNTEGKILDSVMNAVAIAFRLVLTPTQMFIGGLQMLFTAMGGIVEGGKAVVKVLTGDFEGAAKSFESSKNSFANVGTVASGTFEKIKTGWKDAFVDVPAKLAPEAEFAAKTTETKKQDAISAAEKKAQEKRAKDQEKVKAAAEKAEEKHLEKVNQANAKALELLQQLESEHDVIVAHNSLQKEEEKIQEKKRKRLKEINESLADEEKKEAARVMINRSAEAETDRVREEYRKKQEAADQAAAEKRLADEKFILEQERQAHNALFDWQEIQHKNNAAKLAQIKKERLDVELKYTQDKLQAELLAEQTKAAASIQDLDLLAQTLNALEEKYNQQSLLAVAKTAEEKKKIDADLLQKKKENLENYSNAFSALLAGDVSGFVAAAGKIVQGQKSALAERLSADMAYYEAGAQAATQAVSFLNDLAQAKAEKAIALANKERDEKVAILENEIAVTEVLINNASEYAKNLKEAETARMAELQRILTDETSTEEQKRAALFAYYSQQHEQMKAAEEAKLTELHRLAAMAQTDEEKRAVEEKIRLAEQESAEKIRLSEEELEAKKNNIQDITDFSEESSQTMLADAEAASQKQLELADQEAVLKMEFKQDLEETIAAENRKARATETAEKKKAWEAQKKADIATALITGALAVLKALANFFPLNIILAASAAVLTGVQVAKIKNQASPAFAHGGFVPQGGYHGSSYGDGGIALIDRASGQEVGEMEGDEAIVSRKQTAANWPIIEKMFRNARTPGMENKPVAFAAGGFVSPYWQKDMYLFGSKKKKREAEQAAYQAEQDAKAAQADADAYMGEVGFDASGVPTGDTSGGAEAADANASYAAAQKQGEMQIELLTSILESSDAVGETVAKVGDAVLAVKDAVNQVRAAVDESTNATRGVESAVRSNNNHGILHGIMERISSLA